MPVMATAGCYLAVSAFKPVLANTLPQKASVKPATQKAATE